MGRPRKSLNELSLNGALQNRPGRYADRINPPAVIIQPIGRPPTHLTSEQRTVWAELVRQAPVGMLTKHDRLSLEVAVHLVLRLRSGHAKNAEVTSLSAALASLGMTPSSRRRMNYEAPVIAEPVPEEDDPWAGL